MSGSTIGGNLPKFTALDRLIAEEASALVVDRSATGLAGASSGTMAMSSGLHYAFGVGKSDEHVAANRQSLANVLDYIEHS
jgi:hypothetical protein